MESVSACVLKYAYTAGHPAARAEPLDEDPETKKQKRHPVTPTEYALKATRAARGTELYSERDGRLSAGLERGEWGVVLNGWMKEGWKEERHRNGYRNKYSTAAVVVGWKASTQVSE
jgi:hypothetical protein